MTKVLKIGIKIGKKRFCVRIGKVKTIVKEELEETDEEFCKRHSTLWAEWELVKEDNKEE